MSDVLTAAIAWRKVRLSAIEAPLRTAGILAAAEAALDEAVRVHVEAAEKLPKADARAIVKGACRAVGASPLAQVQPMGKDLRKLAEAIDTMHAEIEGGGDA